MDQNNKNKEVGEQSTQSNEGKVNYSQRLENLDRLYGEGIRSQKEHKRNARLATLGVALVGVAAVVVPIVIYNNVNNKHDNKHYVEINSSVENFQSYSMTLKEGSTISDLTTKLNSFVGHKLVGIYKDAECKIPYDANDKLGRNTVVYLKYEKEKYKITLPSNNERYFIAYDEYVDINQIEWDETFSFKIQAGEAYNISDVKVYANGTALDLNENGEYEIRVDQDISITVENVNIKQFNIGEIPNGVTVTKGADSLESNAIVSYGDTIVLSYAITEGYQKTLFKVNGNEVDTNYSLRVTSDISIEYRQEKIKYGVELPKDEAGYVFGNRKDFVEWGDDYTFTVTMAEGYEEPTIKNGESVLSPIQKHSQGKNTVYEYKISNIKSDVGISISGVVKVKYHVVFKDWNGNVLKDVSVDHGDPCTQPEDPTRASQDGYDYAFIGWNNEIPSSITSDLEFIAQYEEKLQEFTLTESVENCSINIKLYRNGQHVNGELSKVKYGDIIKIEATPTNGCVKVSLNVIGAQYDEAEEGYKVNDNVVITATGVGLSQQEITLVQGQGYTLSFADGSSGSVDYNGSCTINIVKDEGYEITEFLIDGVLSTSFSADKEEYTLDKITHNPTISATAKLKEYTLSNIPSQVKVTRSNTLSKDTKKDLVSGDKIYYWDQLEISYFESEGCECQKFVVNGQTIANESISHTVKGEVGIEYTEKAITNNIILPTDTKGYTITYTDKSTDLTIFDAFTFTIDVWNGYNLENDGVTISGNAQLTKISEHQYTISQIKSEVELSVVVNAIYHEISVPQSQYYKFTLVTTDGEEDIGSSIKIAHGEQVEVKFVLTEGYTLNEPVIKLNSQALSKNASGNYLIDGTESGAIVVDCIFELNEYTINVEVDDLQSNEYVITFDGYNVGDTVSHGSDGIMFTVDLAEKYSGCTISVTGGVLRSFGGAYIINDVTDNIVVKLSSPIVKTYEVTEQGEGYLLVFEDTNIIEYGENAEFTIQLDADRADCVGYTVKVGGTVIEPNAQGKYVIENVTQDIEVLVTEFKYQLTIPTGTGYSISYNTDKYGAGPVLVLTEGDEFDFAIVLDAAYSNSTVEVSVTNASLIQEGSQYTITEIKGSVALSISDPEINTYSVTDETAQKEGYTLSIDNATVEHGGSATIRFSLNADHTQSTPTIKVNGTEVTLTEGEYTISGITEDKAITVEGVALNEYTVTFMNEGVEYNGQTIKHGQKAKVPTNPTKAPTTQYYYTFDGWKIPGGDIVDLNEYIITANTTFEAVYSEREVEYTLTYSALENAVVEVKRGEDLINNEGVIHFGDELQLTITPNEGYDKDEIFVSLVDSSKAILTNTGINQYTITEIKGSVALSISDPEINTYSVTDETAEKEGYTLSIDNATVEHGGSATIRFSLNADHTQSTPTIKVNGTEVTLTEGEYTISGITEDKAITVEGVALNEYTVIFMNEGVEFARKEGVVHNGYVSELEQPTKDKDEQYTYTFIGWKVEGSDDVIEDIATYPIVDNITLEAVYEETEINFILTDSWFRAVNAGTAYVVAKGDANELVNKTKVVIPATYNGKPVVGIKADDGRGAYNGHGVFYSIRDTLKTVIFEENDNFKYLDQWAFSGSTALTDIILPASLTSIGDSAFLRCEALTQITIPKNVSEFGSFVFNNCSSLESVTFEDGINISSIGGFENCTSLKQINIPSSVTSIPGHAFKECDSLTKLTIPANVTSLGENIISGCDKLETVEFEPGSKLETIGQLAFAGCPALKTITIPSSVSIIKQLAFSNTTNLESVTFEQPLGWQIPTYYVDWKEEPIDYEISSARLSDATTAAEFLKIHDGNFRRRDYVLSASWFEETTNGYTIVKGDIDEFMWYKIIIPSNFEGKPVVGIKDSTTNRSPFYDVVRKYTDDDSTQFVFETTDKFTTIGKYAFADCRHLTSITLPEGVTTIGKYAFEDCQALQHITIPASVKTINDFAFSISTRITGYGDGLASITFEEGSVLTTIGHQAFEDTVLQEITIPKSVTDIESAFFGCEHLEKVIFEEESLLKKIGASAFNGCTSLTDINLPKGLTEIQHHAFYGCESLASITIPYTVISIGSLNQGVTAGAYSSFSGCTSLNRVIFENPYGWRQAGAATYFESSDLANYMTAAEYLKDTYSVPWECHALVEDDWFALNDAGTGYEIKAGETLRDSLKNKIIIPPTHNNKPIVGIQAEAFSGRSIGEVIFQTDENFTYIGDYAFKNSMRRYTQYNGYIQDITIPNSVTTIGRGAFSGCYGLATAHIPDGVTELIDTFEGCKYLKNVRLPSTLERISETTFGQYVEYESDSGLKLEDLVYYTDADDKVYYLEFTKLNYYIDDNGNKYLGNETNNYLVLMRMAQQIHHADTKIIYSHAFSNMSGLNFVYENVVQVCPNAFKNLNGSQMLFEDIDTWYVYTDEEFYNDGAGTEVTLGTSGAQHFSQVGETYVDYYWIKK